MVVFVATMVLPQYSVVLAVLLPERSVAVAVVELEVLVDCCCELRVLLLLLLLAAGVVVQKRVGVVEYIFSTVELSNLLSMSRTTGNRILGAYIRESNDSRMT